MKMLVFTLLMMGNSVVAMADGVDRVIVRDFNGQAYVVSVDQLSYNQNGELVIPQGTSVDLRPHITKDPGHVTEPATADLRPHINQDPGHVTKPIFVTAEIVVDGTSVITL